MNYVIQVNDSCFPQDLIEDKWTDESSNRKYNNVFALKSICDFPENIEENDSFNFVIDNEKENNCAVCEAYTPVPNKSISIYFNRLKKVGLTGLNITSILSQINDFIIRSTKVTTMFVIFKRMKKNHIFFILIFLFSCEKDSPLPLPNPDPIEYFS